MSNIKRCLFPHGLPCLAHREVATGTLQACDVCAPFVADVAAARTGELNWFPYFTTHGDPYVITDPSRPMFTQVCKVDTSPADYGKANTFLLAAAKKMKAALAALRDSVLYKDAYESEDQPAMEAIEARYPDVFCREFEWIIYKVNAFKDYAMRLCASVLEETEGKVLPQYGGIER